MSGSKIKVPLESVAHKKNAGQLYVSKAVNLDVGDARQRVEAVRVGELEKRLRGGDAFERSRAEAIRLSPHVCERERERGRGRVKHRRRSPARAALLSSAPRSATGKGGEWSLPREKRRVALGRVVLERWGRGVSNASPYFLERAQQRVVRDARLA